MRESVKLFNKISRTHSCWGRKPLGGLLEIFKDIKETDVVMDPFCGGGTSVLAALIRGARVIASDLNPMAVFLTSVLIRPISIPALLNAYQKVEEIVSRDIYNVYTFSCPRCKREANIDYIKWNGKGTDAKPESAKIICESCGYAQLYDLSLDESINQIKVSRMVPVHWYPKTNIKSSRKIDVSHHYELFTDRNLSMLAVLHNAISQVESKSCRNALFYVFTAILYNCSNMQMFSEKDPSSSPGWTALRYYIPTKRKEKNVWNVFKTRFEKFKECKEEMNRIIPNVRITNCQNEFEQRKLEVLLCEANVFDLPYKLKEYVTHVFLDPPYYEDIEFLSFSEFWGVWLRMDFNHQAEYHIKNKELDLYIKRLAVILKNIKKSTKNPIPVTLVLGACRIANPYDKVEAASSRLNKRQDGASTIFSDRLPGEKKSEVSREKLLKAISNAGYSIDEGLSGQFLYTSASKSRKPQDRYLVLKATQEHVNGLTEGKKIDFNNSIENKNKITIINYFKATAFLYKEDGRIKSPNVLRTRVLELIPQCLRPSFQSFFSSKSSNEENKKISDEIIRAIEDDLDNCKNYHSLCFNLLNIIFSKSNIKIDCLNPSQFNFTFLKGDGEKVNLDTFPYDWAQDGAAIAITGHHKMLFLFDDLEEKVTSEVAKKIYAIDNDQFERLCFIIFRTQKDMIKSRGVECAGKWPRVFFMCFSEIRKRAEEIDRNSYLQICALPIRKENGEENHSAKIAKIKAKIVENIPVGEGNVNHFKLKFRAPNLHNINPGQFVMIKTQLLSKKKCHIEKSAIKPRSELNPSNCSALQMKPSSYLKRPFGIHRAFYKNFKHDYLKKISLPKSLSSILHTVFPDEFDIFYKVIKNGVGTHELTELKKGTQIEIIGPLGKRVNLRELHSKDLKEIHVVGGGVGMAPLVFMVQALRFFNFKVKAFIGIVRYDFLKLKDDYTRSYGEDPESAYLYIRDLLDAGLSKDDIYISCNIESEINGSKIPNYQIGFISNYYEEYLKENALDEGQKLKAYTITCGPPAMMKAVYQITNRYEIPLKVLMEKRMACGIGVCLSCVCHAKAKNGEKQYLRVCKEGPLFDAEEIDWDYE